jgi:hypothetical protein
VIDFIYTSIPIEVNVQCVRKTQYCGVQCVSDIRHNTVECSVYVRRGWLYVCVGYCNSPLNNKNIDYHFPMVFSHIGFPHKSLCQLCDCCSWFNIGFIFFSIRILLRLCFRCLTSGIKAQS